MALPASVPTGTVTGTWYTPSGSLAVGTIVFLLLESIEVPDDPDGVVIPVKTVVDVPAGVLSRTLPAGTYQVSVRLSELYRVTKVVEIEAGSALNLPDAVGLLLPDPDLYDPVRSVNGNFPDAYGNIVVSGGGGGAVDSVFGRTGVVVAANGDYTKAQVGLSNVDNTTDAGKPVSTATQTALDGKANTSHTHIIANVTGLQTALDAKQDSGDYATNTALANGLATKANTAHTHVISNVTGLQAALDGKTDESVLTTKGDLYVASGSATPVRIGVGSDNQVLTADSAQSTGVKWATPSAGSSTFLTESDYLGFVAWSGDPLYWMTKSGVGNGDVSLIRMPIPAGKAINKVWIAVSTAGSYSANGVPNQLGVWDDTGALLSLTPDNPALYTSNGWRSGTLTTPIASSGTPRFCYVGFILGGMTGVQLFYPSSASLVGATAEGNIINGGNETKRRAAYLTSQTSLPSSFTPSSVGTVTAYIPLVAISS